MQDFHSPLSRLLMIAVLAIGCSASVLARTLAAADERFSSVALL